MFGCKVDVFFHMSCIGSMMSVRFQLLVISLSNHDILRIGIGPCRASSREVFPPHTNVFSRLYPGSIFYLTRLIQIQNQVGSQNVASIVAHNNRTPRSHTPSLNVSLISILIGRQVCTHKVSLCIQVQMHGRIIYQCCFMNIDIQSVIRLQHKRSLYSQIRSRRFTSQRLIASLIN